MLRCISAIAHGTGHLSCIFWAFCISSFENFLLRSFACFSTGFLFVVVEFLSCLYLLGASALLDQWLVNMPFPFCWINFQSVKILLCRYFWESGNGWLGQLCFFFPQCNFSCYWIKTRHWKPSLPGFPSSVLHVQANLQVNRFKRGSLRETMSCAISPLLDRCSPKMPFAVCIVS